ncbi:MAG: histidine kinase [Bifidobacteriaceae bacterium]|nr:histidine kinase [Bifidobacteriaceae bacterium]
MDLAAAGSYLMISGGSLVTTAPADLSSWGSRRGGWLEPLLAGIPATWLMPFGAASCLIGAVMLVAWRRRHPVRLLVAALCLDALGLAAVGNSEGWLAFFGLFAVAQRASSRAAWIGLAATCAELAVFGLAFGDRGAGTTYLIPSVAMYVLVVSFFVQLGNRRRYVAALIDSAEHLALERDQRAQIAVADERARIAREMHDVVAHSVAVMVTLADGAQAAIERQPERAREAMAMVAQTGRQTVADMRRLLAVLRTEPDLAPQPSVGELAPLVDSFKRLGLPVRLELTASLPEDQAFGLTVFRIVQESLTNVLRHAPGAESVLVRITQPGASEYRVEVVNGPPAADAAGSARPWQGSGQGLIGMGQRVSVFGGSLEAGPTADGGWRVVATLNAEERP